MALPAALSSLFSERCLTRGEELHRSGAVEIVEQRRGAFCCSVHEGWREYSVRIGFDSWGIASRCDCAARERCEHVWAAFLEADEQGLLSIRPGESRPAPVRDWRERLATLRRNSETAVSNWLIGREIVYFIDHAATLEGRGLAVQVAVRERKRGGDWTRPKPLRLSVQDLTRLPDPTDRRVLSLLNGTRDPNDWDYCVPATAYGMVGCEYRLGEDHQTIVLPLLCATGRSFLRLKDVATMTGDGRATKPLEWDAGEPWQFRLQVQTSPDGEQYWVSGSLRRGDELRRLSEPWLLTAGGLVFLHDRVARLDHGDAFVWVAMLRREDSFAVATRDGAAFVAELLSHRHVPPLDLPPDLRIEEVRLPPRPVLKITAPNAPSPPTRWRNPRLSADLAFEYDGHSVRAGDVCRGSYQADARRFLLRDPPAEAAAMERLRTLGFRPVVAPDQGEFRFELAPRHLPAAVRVLASQGWKVEAVGKLYRPANTVRFKVKSGIDWFDLSAAVSFDEVEVPFPALLRALERGEKTVLLGDGTFGILPEDWLRKYQLLIATGEETQEGLRFGRPQVGMLDALLAGEERVEVDQTFQVARDRLREFESVAPADAPGTFVGALRPYQRDGLGWLHFLRQFGFGGCLADDMGLGKTVQVLALLDSRRREQETPRASLVVAPRSLIFNWKQEAQRFTPHLRVFDHTGAERPREASGFDGCDVVLTTYGTLRRDVSLLQKMTFDYAILDESQAIKNAGTESAKAARRLRADHRLALSGTPIENHIGELWSLFEFLNPGLLGRVQAFETNAGASDGESRALLARSLKPFFLRRTKEQVIDDLPPKVEQTVYCDLEGDQRRLYHELREHYRVSLLKRIDRDGINKSKTGILEALLRLRQAACHPGLIDKGSVGTMSAKLEALLAMIEEVRAEGHKALIFSQFVSLLTIVRGKIEEMGLPYEYLDGKTRDRAQRIRHFQEDPDCSLFLVSLKAGGLGLNLTAADYVFLLDPWWNPAVETQAIDRTHRIGQARRVFAYRLIARDTVEEKVLALQASKRDLADSILGPGAGLIRGIRREDIELLLS